MTNVQKLADLSAELLGDIRQAFGAAAPNDPTCDHKINAADPGWIVSQWSRWKLGTTYWWLQMETIMKQLKDKP
jgi:hypothetical protein